MNYVLIILFFTFVMMFISLTCYFLGKRLSPMPSFTKAVILYPVHCGLLGYSSYLYRSLKIVKIYDKSNSKGIDCRCKIFDNGIYVEEINSIFLIIGYYARAFFVPWECLSGSEIISVPYILIPIIKLKFITFNIEGVDLAIGFSSEKSILRLFYASIKSIPLQK